MRYCITSITYTNLLLLLNNMIVQPFIKLKEDFLYFLVSTIKKLQFDFFSRIISKILDWKVFNRRTEYLLSLMFETIDYRHPPSPKDIHNFQLKNPMDLEKIPPGRVDESWNWNKNPRNYFAAHIKPSGVVAVVSFTAGEQFPPDVATLTGGEGEGNTGVRGSSADLWSELILSDWRLSYHGQTSQCQSWSLLLLVVWDQHQWCHRKKFWTPNQVSVS